MVSLDKSFFVLLLMHVLAGCLYVPITGPKSEGVAEKKTVEALIGANEFEVRRQLGDPQWLFTADSNQYLIYQGWQQHGLVFMVPLGFMGPPPASWLERRYCWLLDFGREDVLQHVDRRISRQDCRGVFWTEEQIQSLEPGDAQTMWQLYAESVDPAHREWHWLCQAADEGHSLARHRLGTIYYYGLDGVERDLVLAYVWYALAEQTGAEVKQLAWIRESLTPEQLVAATHLISAWRVGWCERELFERLKRTQ